MRSIKQILFCLDNFVEAYNSVLTKSTLHAEFKAMFVDTAWDKNNHQRHGGINYRIVAQISSVQFSSVAQSCPTLCDHMKRSSPGLPVHHQLLESIQTYVHWVGDAIQPSYPQPCRPLLLLPSIFPSIRVFSNESALCIRWPKYWLELQLQHQSFQWTPRTDLL